MDSYVGIITGTDGKTGLIGSTLYGTCSSSASTVAKIGTLSEFDTLLTGVTIHIKFTNSNTATDPTLNVNSTGAKRIFKNGSTSVGTTVSTSWAAGSVVSLTYDGNAWQMNDHTDNTDTDTKVTQVPISDTDTSTYRIILSNTGTSTQQTDVVSKSDSLLYKPSTGELIAPKLILSNSTNPSSILDIGILPTIVGGSSESYKMLKIFNNNDVNDADIFITPSLSGKGSLGHSSAKWNNVHAINLYGELNGTIASNTTATTQSSSDNSTKVATTAFVQSLSPASTESNNTDSVNFPAFEQSTDVNTVHRPEFSAISSISRTNSRITGDTKSTFTVMPLKRFVYMKTTQDNTWTGTGIGADNSSTYFITLLRTGIGSTANQKNPVWAPSVNQGVGLGISLSDKKGYIGFNSNSTTTPEVSFAAGSYSSTSSEPSWYFKIVGVSGTSYNLDNFVVRTLYSNSTGISPRATSSEFTALATSTQYAFSSLKLFFAIYIGSTEYTNTGNCTVVEMPASSEFWKSVSSSTSTKFVSSESCLIYGEATGTAATAMYLTRIKIFLKWESSKLNIGYDIKCVNKISGTAVSSITSGATDYPNIRLRKVLGIV